MPSLRRLLLAAACVSLTLVLLARVFAGGAAAAEPCSAPGIPTATVYLPNITKTLGGPSGWVTPLYVQNAGAVQTTIELTFLRFRDGAVIACHRTAAVPPGASVVDDPNADADLPDDTQFSVVARSYGADVVASVDQVHGSGVWDQALAYTGFTQGDRTVYLPNVTRRFYGYDVPFIMQNVGAAPASVSARFISFDGTQTYARSFSILPGRSFVIDPDYEPAFDGRPGSGLVDGTQYAVTLTSDEPIAVVANAHQHGPTPVAYSITGLARGATTLYAPYAAKAAPPDGTFSPVVVQNLGTGPTDATLLFTPSAGGLAQRFVLTAIPAGGAKAFDPRFAAGTTTPCAVAGPDCLGPGEYALRVSAANTIAAVVLPNSQTTAAAYLAATELSERALVPTAFRRAGGANGWSTRIAVYASSAAQLTARAFSTGTGELAATFSVPVGTSGIASFDLATVAGLADGEYSVTIDGGGVRLAALALARATSAGDTFMATEALGRAALPVASRPASIGVAPGSTTTFVGWDRQLTATVRDQFGSVLAGWSPTWSLAPATLGTVDASGSFTAGATPGTGTIFASAAGLTTPLSMTVKAPHSVTLGGIGFLTYPVDRADVYTEAPITGAQAQTIVAQVESDVAQVEHDYARAFAGRPSVYALDGGATFRAAARDVGGLQSTLPAWASGVCVCDAPHPDWVFVNWSLESAGATHTTIRHELTHVMEHASIDPSVTLPAWFDEGNARLEEMSAPQTRWWAAMQSYRAASMAARARLFTLDELTSQLQWSLRTPTDATYEYAVAYQAASFLRDDVTAAGIARMFALMDEGRPFEDAYAIVSGRTLDEFAAMFPHRVLALATAYPGIATAPDSPAGPGLTFVIYGLPANASVSYRITGTATSQLTATAADAYGVLYTYLDERWRSGTYTLTVSWSGGTISGTGVKP